MHFPAFFFYGSKVGVDPLGRSVSQQSSTVDSQMKTSTLTTDQPSKILEKWEDKHVRLLIECYLKYKDQLGKPQQTKKKVFDKIAEEFNRVSDVVVSGDQCFRKWKKLESKQKEIEDNNSQTGREKKTWKFHKEMEDCLGDNASVKPVFTFETSGGSSSSSSRPSTPSHFNSESDGDCDETEDGCSSQKDPQKKRLKRKRKSRSSASEMIEFLKDYSEKREKVEEEKVNILKAMHEEKKQFFSQFFTYLKDSKK